MPGRWVCSTSLQSRVYAWAWRCDARPSDPVGLAEHCCAAAANSYRATRPAHRSRPTVTAASSAQQRCGERGGGREISASGRASEGIVEEGEVGGGDVQSSLEDII